LAWRRDSPIREDRAMIPALPEKDHQNVAPAGATPTAPISPGPMPRVSDAYDQDVLNFVTRQIDRGDDESAIVESLLPHDFSRSEAQRLVREIASERSKIAPRVLG